MPIRSPKHFGNKLFRYGHTTDTRYRQTYCLEVRRSTPVVSGRQEDTTMSNQYAIVKSTQGNPGKMTVLWRLTVLAFGDMAFSGA